jgi:ATP-dependent Clp protease ATP-binding subunit ClpA/DNA-binding response OmpR family regulator
MPRGYDDAANRAWDVAKSLALAESRPLTLVDLWLGSFTVFQPDLFDLTLPPDAVAQLDALRGRTAEGTVSVSPEVTAFDKAVRARLAAYRREVAGVADMVAILLESGDSAITALCTAWGLDTAALKTALQPPAPAAEAIPAAALHQLSGFVVNLTEQAAQGKLSLSIARDAEIASMVRTLMRRKKRNVALVGPAGVGKTKLVEDLAVRLQRGLVPRLAHCTVLALDLMGLRAGTAMQGELENRVKSLVATLTKYGENIILFIDELHTIVGTSVGGSALDLANALKPLLASGSFRCIGATTRQEYVEYIEADHALARRFQMLSLSEPSNELVLEILRSVQGEYAEHHGVVYTPESLAMIIEMCDRFLPQRHYPDKALDLLDEAGAWLASLPADGEETPQVTPDMVQAALADKLHLPLAQITAGTCVGLAAKLGAVVLGQESALAQIEEAIITASSDRSASDHPRDVMLFVGPDSAGKSLAARTLAAVYCHNERALLDLDLDQLVHEHTQGSDSMDVLVGPRPPYVGWERGGVLTNHVLEMPQSVVLVRGIERAPEDAVRLFESIFQRGECEDGRSQRVSFRETLFIFCLDFDVTQRHVTHHIGFGANVEEVPVDVLRESGIPVNLQGMIKHVITFAPLSPAAISEITRRRMEALKDDLWSHERKVLTYDAAFLNMLTFEGGAALSPEQISRRIDLYVRSPLFRMKGADPARWATMSQIDLRSLTDGAAALRPRVLVVDDQADFCDGLRAAFSGYEWKLADGTRSAVQTIAAWEPHLVLIDTCQSATDAGDTRGLTILRELKAQCPQQTMVMVTAQDVCFDTTREAFRAGAYDYLWKSADASLLQQLVELLVTREMQASALERRQGIFGQDKLSYDIRVGEDGGVVIHYSPSTNRIPELAPV